MKLKIAKLFSLVKNNLLLASVVGGAVAGGAIFVASNLIVTPSTNVSAESLINSNDETKSMPIITETNTTEPSSEIISETTSAPQAKSNTKTSVQQNESSSIISNNISINNEVETIIDNTLEPTTTNSKTSDEEKYYYLTFMLRDGTYCLIDVDDEKGIPSVLQIPETFNGIPVTTIEDCVLEDINTIVAIIIPTSVTKVGNNLCGVSCKCHTLKAIICMGDTPFYFKSLALDNYQLNGGCYLYVPNNNIDKYKSGEYWDRTAVDWYSKLIKPMSELNESIYSQVSFN